MKFHKLVVVDNTGMNQRAKDRLRELSDSVAFYDDFPQDSQLVKDRICGADGLMVSYVTPITREIIESCPTLRYIGMCCTLYGEDHCNVDLRCAREKGIEVKGITDYGDQGVIEYGISALVDLLHGFQGLRWKERPQELDGQKIGMLGLGNTGMKLAKALQIFGAEIYYCCRSEKEEANALGMKFLPLPQLLQTVDIVAAQLPRDCILLGEEEFRLFGSGKILLNTSIGPVFSMHAMKKWLEDPNNYYLCDEVGMEGCGDSLEGYPNVLCCKGCAGSSTQCTFRLSEKSVANAEAFLGIEHSGWKEN